MKRQRLAFAFVVCCLMAALVVNPTRYVQSVYFGLLLFGASVLPALFPFFFFTRLLTGLGVAADLGKLMSKPTRFLFRAPSSATYIFVMSLLSGYPVGARLLSDFYDADVLSSEECKRISAFTSTSGPLFIVGTVGSAIIGTAFVGYVVYLAHFLSAVLTGVIFRPKTSKVGKTVNLPLDIDNLLGNSMEKAVSSILVVGGYVAIFNMVADVALDVGIISALAKPFEFLLLAVDFKLAPYVEPVLISLIEVSRGAVDIGALSPTPEVACTLLSLTVSFGGLGVALQSLTYLAKCKIKASFYFLTKTTQGIIAAVCGFLISIMFF